MISQWARERRNAEQERDSDYGPEDYFEGASRNGRGAENKSNIFIDMIFVVVVLFILFLFYKRFIRSGLALREFEDGRDHNDDEPAMAQNRGLYPPPGDPARDEWAILR